MELDIEVTKKYKIKFNDKFPKYCDDNCPSMNNASRIVYCKAFDKYIDWEYISEDSDSYWYKCCQECIEIRTKK
jgi:hypothetical protein